MNAVTTPARVSLEFDGAYNRIEKEIPFHDSWSNGTGYYGGAVRSTNEHAVKLAPGEMAISHSPMPNDRKIIFVGTALGVIAIFQRYTAGKDDVYTYNVGRDLGQVLDPILGKPLNVNDMFFLTGGSSRHQNNVGQWLSNIVTAARNLI